MARIIPRRNPLTASKALLSGTGVVAPPSSFVWEGGNDNTTDVPVQLNVPLDFDVAARIVGEESITLISGSAPGLSYNPTTMRVTGTPTTEGSYSLLFEANDGQGGGGDAAADWAARISGPGVVWYHNFDTPSEVNQFCWTNDSDGKNDPNRVGSGSQYVTHQMSGGADGGGFMRLTYPLGSASGRGGSYWWRQLNPLTGASNGRGQNDPGASGTIALATFAPTNLGAQTYNWGNASNPGWYMHPTHQASYPGKFQGHDFWLQVRVRRAQTPGAPPDSANYSDITGKNVWLTTTNSSFTAQELVTMGQSASNNNDQVGVPSRHNIYVGQNFYDLAGQPNATTVLNNRTINWRYSGGWDTLLYHVTPGTSGGTGANRTRVEVWAAKPGETSYTKIWDVTYTQGYTSGTTSVGAPHLPGWNALILAIYHNGSAFTTSEFNFDYDQVIFSKETIPCPQV